jgi:hypothetical protein
VRVSNGFVKYVMATIQVALGFELFLVTLGRRTHTAGLNAYGCHNNRRARGYHCHCGPVAGQSFSSKEEMLKELAVENTDSKVQTDVKK